MVKAVDILSNKSRGGLVWPKLASFDRQFYDVSYMFPILKAFNYIDMISRNLTNGRSKHT